MGNSAYVPLIAERTENAHFSTITDAAGLTCRAARLRQKPVHSCGALQQGDRRALAGADLNTVHARRRTSKESQQQQHNQCCPACSTHSFLL
jgi:hypothetical protein